MAVELRCATARGRSYADWLRNDAASLLRVTGLRECELSLMLVGDRSIRRLNRDFRNKDEATDVLSFPQLEGPVAAGVTGGASPTVLLGDIVLSVDSARRQARELAVGTPARLRALLIHGFLHLLGYDHERSPAEARRMLARERKLAASLGPAAAPAVKGGRRLGRPAARRRRAGR